MSSLESRHKIHFPTVIGIPESDLKTLIAEMDNQYNEWEEIKYDKVSGLPKSYKDGTIKKRVIRPSKAKLKMIQTRINTRILNLISLPTCVHGGRKKHSNVTNARAHKGRTYILTTDLQDFYPSIDYRLVYRTFLNLGFNKQCAFYLTRFCTWKENVPQGAPTSTQISNLIFLETDLKLMQLCADCRIMYTRYIDDLTFSASYDISHIIPAILKVVKDSGLKISWRKTLYARNQTVTGIDIFLNKIAAPRKILIKVEEEKLLPDDVRKPYTNYNNYINKVNNL